MSEERNSVQVRVMGRVQGVSFRAWTKAEAEALGLDGWVRNEDDGSVSALLSGAPEAVRAMQDRLREGPAAADVRDLEAHEAEAPDWSGMRVL